MKTNAFFLVLLVLNHCFTYVFCNSNDRTSTHDNSYDEDDDFWKVEERHS